MNNRLKKTRRTIHREKKQGWFKSTFNDSENVDELENQIKIIKTEILKMDKEIITLKNNIRKKSNLWTV